MVYDVGFVDCYMIQISMVYDATLIYCSFSSVWYMMNLVARITPKGKVFTKKKIFFSRLNAGTTFPIRGIHTPIALAIKIDTKLLFCISNLLLCHNLPFLCHKYILLHLKMKLQLKGQEWKKKTITVCLS